MTGAAAFAPFVLALVLQAPADEDVVRGLVQQYYEAQTARDADKALAFWSLSANPRMSREAFVAVFAAGEAVYTADVQTLAVNGNEARVRVAVAVARTVIRNDVPSLVRQTLLNAELWRREGGSWKLMREGPFAEDFADQLLALAPADRAGFMTEHVSELDGSLRYVLAQRASMAAATRQYARAREIFDLALGAARAAHDRRAESETLQNIANAYYFQATTPGAPSPAEDFARAADTYQQRLSLAREMADEEGTAASLLGLATVSYSRGEYTASLVSYREALAIYEKRDEGASIGRTLVSVGNVQYLQAEYDEATASYRRALDLLVIGMDSQGASFARSGLARVFAAQGDLAAALDTYGQVLANARARARIAPAATDVAAALESIGDIHFRLANTDQARASFDEARRLADADPSAAGRLFGSLGLTEIVAGQFDAALANYTESRTRYESGRIPEGVAHAWVGIGFSHAAREKFADAITAYRTAIRMFEAQRANESAGRAWLGLSIAQSGAADYPAAFESAQKVRTIAAIVKSEDLTWRAEVRAGEVLRQLRRHGEARQAFEAAIATIDRLAADAPTNPDARRQLEDSATAWSGLALTLATQGDAPGALSAVEARRAHIRRVQLGGFQRDITRGTTADERAEEQGIVRELISTRAQLGAERGAGHPDAARLDRLARQLAALVARRADQQTRLYARLPDLQVARGLAAGKDDVSTLMAGGGGVLVDYLVADEEILAVTVAAGESGLDITAAVLPVRRRDLAAKIEKAVTPAVLKDPLEWGEKSAALAGLLLDPIAARLRGRDRLVIIPDDLLWRLPFEALPWGGGTLAAQGAVSYATSLATLGIQRRLASGPGAAPLVAGVAGAPAIPAAIRAQVALTSQAWKEPDTATSLAAARAAAQSFGDTAVVKTEGEATEAAVQSLMETSDLVEILAPLQMSGPTPLFSSLLLGGVAGTPANDGRWEAREWFNLNGRAKVLIIPDGSTLGGAGVGAAMDTMAWAAAAAGISSLVMGRWPAEGFSTGSFLTALHAQLAKGLPVQDAWRAATVSARAQAGAAPSGWAGLRLLGGGPR